MKVSSKYYFKDKHLFWYLQLFRSFFTQMRFYSQRFCTFALASTYDGYEVHWGVRSLRVEHYILKGVTDALFLVIRTTTIESWTRTMLRWHHGVYHILLRSVLRGYFVPSKAHFTGVLYTPAWVFLCLFLLLRLWKASKSGTSRCKHPLFCM